MFTHSLTHCVLCFRRRKLLDMQKVEEKTSQILSQEYVLVSKCAHSNRMYQMCSGRFEWRKWSTGWLSVNWRCFGCINKKRRIHWSTDLLQHFILFLLLLLLLALPLLLLLACSSVFRSLDRSIDSPCTFTLLPVFTRVHEWKAS